MRRLVAILTSSPTQRTIELEGAWVVLWAKNDPPHLEHVFEGSLRRLSGMWGRVEGEGVGDEG